MFKLSTMSAAFFVIAATSASACISYDDVTDTFTNNCATEQYIEVKTSGGGCYTQIPLSFSLKPRESKSFPEMSEPCGDTLGWKGTFGYCDQKEWVSGACKPFP